MKWNPEEYETVKSRKKRFYEDHPAGRIIVESVSTDPNSYAMFKASVYTDFENQKAGCPKATGYAHEIRATQFKDSPVNFTSWNENCEESAVGRALDNAGYSGNLKC